MPCLSLPWVLSQSYQAGYAAGSASMDSRWKTQYNELLEQNQQLTQDVASAQHALDEQATTFERKFHAEKEILTADHERRLAAVATRVHPRRLL